MVSNQFGKYKSRKNKKRALGLGKTGHEGFTEKNLMTAWTPGKILDSLKSKFGISKHRGARTLRFKARQKNKK